MTACFSPSKAGSANHRIRHARTLLFTSADRPEWLTKSLATECDMVVFDLEDGVASVNKPAAREHAAVDLRGRVAVRVKRPQYT